MAEITIERCIEEWCFDDDTDYADPAAKAVNDRLQAELTLLRRWKAAGEQIEDRLRVQRSELAAESSQAPTAFTLWIAEDGLFDAMDGLWTGEGSGVGNAPSLLEAIEKSLVEKWHTARMKAGNDG